MKSVLAAAVTCSFMLVGCAAPSALSNAAAKTQLASADVSQPGSASRWIQLSYEPVDSFAQIVRGYGKYMWMVDHTSIVRFSGQGLGQAFSTPSGLNAYQITPGPRGRIWFSEYGGAGISKIASITPSTGKIREYALPGPSMPNQGETIAAGSDGKLWFGAGPGRVGSMTVSGTVVYYAAPTQDLILSLTPGSDGNVWTINSSTTTESSIYKITPAGEISVYPIFGNPSVNNGQTCPVQIISGPAGDLYFTDPCAMWVGRFSPSGAVTATYSSPIRPFFLTTDGFAHVFFTAMPTIHTGHERGSLGILDTATGATSYRTAPQDGMRMTSTALGADGNIWMAPESAPWSVTVFVRLLLEVSPQTIQLSPGQQQTIAVSETQYRKNWTVGSFDESVATVAPGNSAGTYVVTGVSPGSTSIFVRDRRFNETDVSVTVL